MFNNQSKACKNTTERSLGFLHKDKVPIAISTIVDSMVKINQLENKNNVQQEITIY